MVDIGGEICCSNRCVLLWKCIFVAWIRGPSSCNRIFVVLFDVLVICFYDNTCGFSHNRYNDNVRRYRDKVYFH